MEFYKKKTRKLALKQVLPIKIVQYAYFEEGKFGRMTMAKFSLERLTKTCDNICLIDLWKNVCGQWYTDSS
ncbi:hypothetical protein JCM17204_21380 [Blautia stercoris]|nr:hypothetical protein DXB47_11025 [Firmicutes bacterium OM04-13BH]